MQSAGCHQLGVADHDLYTQALTPKDQSDKLYCLFGEGCRAEGLGTSARSGKVDLLIRPAPVFKVPSHMDYILIFRPAPPRPVDGAGVSDLGR